MAVKDGLPATDFSRQNREWVKAVAGGGSGGGGLPDVTSADIGKILGVVNDTDKPVYSYIVPTQKITTDGYGGAVLSDVDSSLVAEGTVCSVIINNTEYSETIDADWYIILPGGITIDFNENNVRNLSPNTEYTVSVATAVGYEPKIEWVAGGGGGGGVLCVHLTYGETTTTMDKTYAEILAAYQAGYFVFVLDVDGNNYYSMLVTSIGPTEDVHDYNYVVVVGESDPMMYYCATTADYPVYTS